MEICLESVSVEYGLGRRRRCIFRNLAWRVTLGGGQVLGLIGESGSGKSTLLRIIAGVARPTAGRIVIEGAEKGDIAFLPQGGVLLEHLDLEDNLRLFSTLKVTRRRFNEKRLQAAVRTLEIDRIIREGRPLEKLSGGEKQRVSLARILSIEPRLVLLDEPCAGLGGDHRTDFLAALKRSAVDLGFSAILASHEWQDHVLVANEVAFLKQANGAGLSDIPLARVSAFSASPWHQEAVAYTTVSPINWVDGERTISGGWALSVGGERLGEVRLEPAPREDRVVLACRPENFSPVPGEGRVFTDAGASDTFAFVGVGEKVLVIPKEAAPRDGELRLQGSVLAFSYEYGDAIGPATIM